MRFLIDLAGSWGRSLGVFWGSWVGLGGVLGGVWWGVGGVLGTFLRALGTSWEGLGAIFATRRSQGPKTPPKGIPGPSLGCRIGAQNRAKPVPRAIQNGIVFLINLQINF